MLPRMPAATLLGFLGTGLLLAACGGGGGGSAPPSRPAPKIFNDVTAEAGLDLAPAQVTITANGVGAATADYDGDGFLDILVIRDRMLPALLFRNRGDGSFEERSKEAKLEITGNACGPCFADIDGDGDADLLVCGVFDARPKVFRNEGDGSFTDVTASAGIVMTGESCGAAFGDYDRDGDLDVFITRWERNNPSRTKDEHLWRNNGDFTFTDVSAASKISDSIRISPQGDLSFTPNWADINNDGWPDLLIAADFNTSVVYLNNKDGSFKNISTAVLTDDNGMGAAVADYDHDSDLDWFVSSIYSTDTSTGWTGNRLYRNKGDGTFEDATTEAGVRDGGWGWAASFSDFNQDGHLDIAHVNGWINQGFEKDPSKLFMSNGDGTFTESAERLGFLDTDQGRGLICLDYDNDGDLDVFLKNLDQPWRLLRNDLEKGAHLIVELAGKGKNSAAIGARVYAKVGSKTQMRELRCGSNFVSQDPSYAHFGLGAATSVDELTIVWPDGSKTVQTNVPTGQRLKIKQQ